MIARFLAIGAAASLLTLAAAGNAGASAGSIWQVVPSVNPQPHQVTDNGVERAARAVSRGQKSVSLLWY